MTRFWGTHSGRLDRKGRIAIPAVFRSELEASGSDRIVFRSSLRHPCIEGRSGAIFDELIERINQMQDLDEDADALATATLADVHLLRPDGDGRLVLPGELIEAAGLQEAALFLGKGKWFEIWEERAGRAHLAAMRALVREKGLKPPPPLNTTPRAVS